MTSDKPYHDKLEEQHGTGLPYIIRTFKESVDPMELIWHRDKESRHISILSGTDWKLQLDDELPVTLKIGGEYYIRKERYHRVIKGEGDLVVRIENI